MKSNELMPVYFIGHGSPMNAIANNDYTKALNKIANSISTPKAILMVSAHWLTKGTRITSMKLPKTIHDFGGFPKDLFEIKYPAIGDSELANQIINRVGPSNISPDFSEWGLDHGTWSVLRHIYPDANIPVLQLSLDMSMPAEFHFNLGKEIQFLGEQNVLIIGSGNVVHNLQLINWNENASAYDWAIEFDLWVKEKLLQKDFHSLVNDFYKMKTGKLSHPSLEHYLPLLYILGTLTNTDQLNQIFEGFQHASISMSSFKWDN